jgi:hypothetical protein
VNNVYVYWIHHIDHTDPYSEGYVGISFAPIKRFEYHSHKKYNDNYELYENIKNGAMQTILHICTCRKEAFLLEQKYRPSEKIGWNIIPGGASPPSRKGCKMLRGTMTGKKQNLESNKKRSITVSKLKWWNNGETQLRAENCPPGFIRGKMPNKKKYTITKLNHTIGKSGKKIITPHGLFETITLASKKLGLSWDQVSWRIKSKNYPDWTVNS